MSIGNINTNPNAAFASVAEATEETLAIARQEQVKESVGDQSLKELNKSVKNTTQLVVLDAPKVDGSGSDFFAAMIQALTDLAGLLGDMADSTITELQFKRDQIKELLKDKLKNIEETETQRMESLALQNQPKSRRGLFGSVMNFMFAAVEIVGGAFTIAGGIISGNMAMVAGGAMLVASGTLGIAAEAISLSGGSEKTADILRGVSEGLMIAGIVTATFGAGAAAAQGMAAKKAISKASQEGLEKAAKEVAEKAAKEVAEKGAKEIAEKGAKEVAEKTAKSVAQSQADDIAKLKMRALKKDAGVKLYKQGIVNGGGLNVVTQMGLKTYEGILTVQQHSYDVRAAELEKEITELGSKLDAILQQQEFIQRLIELLQERMVRAVSGPIEDALKSLSSAIQDRGGAATRIAASMAV